MKKNIQLKKIALSIFMLGSIAFTNAQVKIGDNPTTINSGSVLELESTNKGLLMPRVSLVSTNQWTLTGTPVAGMKVYNTNATIIGNAVAPKLKNGFGEYYWDGSIWVALGQVKEPDQVVNVLSLACGLTSPNVFSGGTVDPDDAAQGGVLADDNTVYLNKCDGTSWVYNPAISSYVSYTAKVSTEWNYFYTSIDAGANKVNAIQRQGNVWIGKIGGKNFGLSTDANTAIDRTELYMWDLGTNKYFSLRSNWAPRYDYLDITGTPTGTLMSIGRVNGNVGIGNETPTSRLEVWTLNGNESKIRLGQAGLTDYGFRIPASVDRLDFQRGSLPIATINVTGMGIKTTSPTATLDVIGDFKAGTGTTGMRIVQGGYTDVSAYGPSAGLSINYGNNIPTYINSSNNGNVSISAGGTSLVGIGTNFPSEKLHVVGNILASGTITPSDRRLKSNILPVNDGLKKIMELQPVSYDKKFSLDSKENNTGSVHEIGFIAQDMQKTLPEIVYVGKDENKTLAINYTSLIPVLTKAIQEQQAQIEELKAQIKELTKK